MSPAVLPIRRDLRPGDLDRVARLHGASYAAEYGLDATFESDIAVRMTAVAERGFPGAREGAWIAERDGRLAGFIALTDEGENRGQVRWFIVDAAERGSGLGRRLLRELLAAASTRDYRILELTTFSELVAAARLYRDAGFSCVESAPELRWGRTLEIQRYELDLQSGAIRGAA